MNSVAAANQEEAATIAAEFLSSLDNLPNEVQHLLEEIRHRETRCQELQQEVIQKESTRYIRHALKNNSTPKENGKDKESKDALIPGRISAAYFELDQLANEKIALSAKLVDALNRVSARLEHDLTKVVQLSGEPAQEQYEVRGGYVVGTLPGAPAPITLSANTPLPANSARSVKEVQESLRASVVNELSAVNASPSPGASAQGPQKRRRLNTGASVASINVSVSRAQTPQARSRLQQQVHPSPPPGSAGPRGAVGRRLASPTDEDADGDNEADADGDDDLEDSGDAEDKELYCFCQKMSYGEMIGCDNEDCQYQWFHLGCVGLRAPLPDSWYCDECLKSLGALGGRARQGRRKGQ